MPSKFTDLRVYQLAEELADLIWTVVVPWDSFSKDVVGKQLCRAADSIGANIAEGVGKKSYPEQRRFTLIARGSMYETQHWLRRAFRRGLLNQDQIGGVKQRLDSLAPQLNNYLKYLAKKVRERKPA